MMARDIGALSPDDQRRELTLLRKRLRTIYDLLKFVFELRGEIERRIELIKRNRR